MTVHTHDAQVVMYEGPDADHAGQEIAFCFNGSAGVAIVDVTDKTDMQLVSSFNYTQSAYTPPRLAERRPNHGLLQR